MGFEWFQYTMDNILDLLGFFEDNAFEMNCSSATRMALFNLFLT